jgi:hypothetical protein
MIREGALKLVDVFINGWIIADSLVCIIQPVSLFERGSGVAGSLIWGLLLTYWRQLARVAPDKGSSCRVGDLVVPDLFLSECRSKSLFDSHRLRPIPDLPCKVTHPHQFCQSSVPEWNTASMA